MAKTGVGNALTPRPGERLAPGSISSIAARSIEEIVGGAGILVKQIGRKLIISATETGGTNGQSSSVSTVLTLPAIPTSGMREVYWTSSGGGTGDDQVWRAYAGQTDWTPTQFLTSLSGDSAVMVNPAWDRKATPPGASTADLAVVMSGLCADLNNLRELKDDSPPILGYTYPLSPILFPIDDALATTMAYPLASDFDCDIDGPCVKAVLFSLWDGVPDTYGQMYNALISPGVRTPPFSYLDILAVATAGLGPFDLEKPLLSDNWIRLKNTIDEIKARWISYPIFP